ncbi:MAG: response regulator transcription factor [Anaerolineales bacterium]|nr:response regulator transcription factor [Anaerolineales bacterium]
MVEKILVIEDEIALSETLVYNLKRQGYDVHAAMDGHEGLSLARSLKPDLILLDLMLPGIDGLEITRILRKEAKTPILILTAQGEEIDRVLGLELGADDYMAKPFSMRELIARVKAILRRIQLDRNGAQEETLEVHHFGNLTINQRKHEVYLDEKPLKLKPKEYDLLLYLCANHGHVLTRSLILEEVWGWDFSGGTRTVDVHIRWLREKIEEDPKNPVRIITVHGVGYRFDE